LTGATESMQHVPTRTRRPIDRPRGFTLIELMVGLVLGILVCFALVTLFVNNSRARREIDQASQQIENGRYALDLLRDDLHLAGYYGDLVPQQGFTVSTGVVPSVCAIDVAGLNLAAPPAALQWPVAVFGIAGGDAVPACVSSATGGQKAGTDILVLRRTSTVPTTGSLAATKIYLQAAGCKTDLEAHKDFVIDLGANPAAFVRMKRGCSAASPAAIYEFQTRIYYVSNEPIPTLRLLTLSGTSSTNEPWSRASKTCGSSTAATTSAATAWPRTIANAFPPETHASRRIGPTWCRSG
jgi:type IV pilus assembly protein PilW